VSLLRPRRKERVPFIHEGSGRGGIMDFKTNIKIKISMAWLRFLLFYRRALGFSKKQK